MANLKNHTTEEEKKVAKGYKKYTVPVNFKNTSINHLCISVYVAPIQQI